MTMAAREESPFRSRGTAIRASEAPEAEYGSSGVS